jgi:guanylate kinase
VKKPGLIFVVSGPSGSGKTTLLARLLEQGALRNKLVKSISFTTRPKRSGERDKKDYFFISQKKFQELRKAKKILEWTKYLGYYYATPKDFLERQLKNGRHAILCLDLKGALKIKQLYPENTVTIFVMPPSLRVLWERIRKRCQQTRKEEIRQRLQLAKFELLAKEVYDYCLVNQEIRKIVSQLRGVILKEIATRELRGGVS